MNLSSIPAFSDNYIWLLHQQQHCLIVDPGDSAPLLAAIEQHNWQPQAILLTHHHQDHSGGVHALRQRYPALPVYGGGECRAKGANCIVSDGQTLQHAGFTLQVIATPGHTKEHVSYYVTRPDKNAPHWLFCGDTLFSAGCGRLFEGSPAQMYHSLQRLNRLPADTLICCGHEYTVSNLRFALSLLAGNPALTSEHQHIRDYAQKMAEKRQHQQSTLPSTLHIERQINLFLRTDETWLMSQIDSSLRPLNAVQRFAWLRAKKDAA